MGDPLRSRDFVMSDNNDNFTALLRGGAAEAIGVFLFVFTGCGAAISIGGGLYPVAFAFGLAIMVLMFATADISGGHLNPAVTLAFLACGKLGKSSDPRSPDFVKAIVYIGCQCTGAIFGALFLKALTPSSFHGPSHLGCNDIGNISPVQAIFIEIITTFTLVITIFGNAVENTGTANHVAPIPIVFAVVLGILATGHLSGGSMNPARSLGPAVAAGYWHVHYVYWVGPIIGGVLASLLWMNVFHKQTEDEKTYQSLGQGQ